MNSTGHTADGVHAKPRLAVFSMLYPSDLQPGAGNFVRERMTRVARHLPVTVVAPVPWFPFQGLIRRWRPGFRPQPARYEVRDGLEVFRPRVLSIPAIGKSLDGLFMALGSLATLRRLKARGQVEIIDAHFAYPDGVAATLLGGWLKLPVTITLRGTEPRMSRRRLLRWQILTAVRRAHQVFAVAQALQDHVIGLGAKPGKFQVVGNGVDTDRFYPEPQAQAREALGLPAQAPILVSVGALVERKGFHRVMEALPGLRRRFPGLRYLIVGGPGPEGDMEAELKEQVCQLALEGVVHFLGPWGHDQLRTPLSAADAFVLATRNEGWANVFLEAMACGLPVVTTDVGGNREVVAHEGLGRIVPFGDQAALTEALAETLSQSWDRDQIVVHARANGWDKRVAALVEAFQTLHVRQPTGQDIMAERQSQGVKKVR